MSCNCNKNRLPVQPTIPVTPVNPLGLPAGAVPVDPLNLPQNSNSVTLPR